MAGSFYDRTRPEWIELAQVERQAEVDRFNSRRNIEWRLALALWAGFGLAANALREVPLTTGWQWLASILAALLVVLHLFWVRNFMVRASPENWEKGWGLTNLIRDALGINPGELRFPLEDRKRAWVGFEWLVRWLRAEKQRPEKDREPRLLWGHYWQVIVTLVIALLASLAIWFAPSAPGAPDSPPEFQTSPSP